VWPTHRLDQSHIYAYVHREYPSWAARVCETEQEGGALRDLVRILSWEELGQVLIQLKTKMLGYASMRSTASA
jgi:hypothetical protein